MRAARELRRRRIIYPLIASVAVVTWVAGCGTLVGEPPLRDAREVKREQLVGSWEGEFEAALKLRDDGTFTAEQLHTSFSRGEGVRVIGRERIEGSGSWTFGDYGAGPKVDIHFTGGGVASLHVVEKDKTVVLSAGIGDGGSALLVKETAPVP